MSSDSNGCGQHNSSYIPTKMQRQAFLGAVNFWSIHIPDYSQTVNCLYHVTLKNDFKCASEQQQAFEEIKQVIVYAVTHDPFRMGQDAKMSLQCSLEELSFLECLERSSQGQSR